jgi:hypothetical protein
MVKKGSATVRRRFLIGIGGALMATIGSDALAWSATAPPLPGSAGGETLPDTPLARAAADFGRTAMPPFLFNHCMRTYLFGAMLARKDGVDFDHEMMFVAAALHDLGLLKAFASNDLPFEMDSADAAKRFLEQHGLKGRRVELVWNAVAMHASRLLAHQPPGARLVGRGAGLDVVGGGLNDLPADRVRDVVRAFPRLGFKAGFEGLLLDYCDRKPFAQLGTWTDDFCRRHNHAVHFPVLEHAIEASPFTD